MQITVVLAVRAVRNRVNEHGRPGQFLPLHSLSTATGALSNISLERRISSLSSSIRCTRSYARTITAACGEDQAPGEGHRTKLAFSSSSNPRRLSAGGGAGRDGDRCPSFRTPRQSRSSASAMSVTVTALAGHRLAEAARSDQLVLVSAPARPGHRDEFLGVRRRKILMNRLRIRNGVVAIDKVTTAPKSEQPLE